ncbi:hypothetical protein OsI_10829 [Oryza sativa Indica Group]|uniref:Uncharacterized protein n=1 Tax=Oryza sativa subsp. indica TaxID=39946 RepID=A2XER5_ORYSI|nr:hypothetical protein OsI_10829 [Oryza sativa Indica Group]
MRFFLKLAPRCSVLLLLLLVTASRGLNIGDLLGSTPAKDQGCSRTCESQFCTNDYLNTMCNENLLSCIDRVSGATFPGNKCNVGQTASVIRGVIETAVFAGKILHKRDDGQ